MATIAVERPVTLSVDATGRRVGGLQGQDTDAFRFPTWIADVSLQLRYEGEPTADGATTFAIEDPAGNRLLTATIDPTISQPHAARWQAATRSAALSAIAVTVLLFTGPLLDWRNRARSVRPHVTAVVSDVCCNRDRADHPARRLAGGLVGRRGCFPALRTPRLCCPPLLTSPFDFLLTPGRRSRS